MKPIKVNLFGMELEEQKYGDSVARFDVGENGHHWAILYDIESEKVFQSEAFLKERNSPWSSWVRSWYSRRFRIVARRIYPKP